MRRKKFLEDCIGEADTFKVLIYKQSNNNPTLVRIKNQPNWNFIGSLEVLAIVTSDLNETSTSNTKDIDQRLSESITEELNQALPDTPKEIENNKNLGVLFVNGILVLNFIFFKGFLKSKNKYCIDF